MFLGPSWTLEQSPGSSVSGQTWQGYDHGAWPGYGSGPGTSWGFQENETFGQTYQPQGKKLNLKVFFVIFLFNTVQAMLEEQKGKALKC